MGGCCSTEDTGIVHHRPEYPAPPPVNTMYPPSDHPDQVSYQQNPDPPMNPMYPPPVNSMYPPSDHPDQVAYQQNPNPPMNPMYPPTNSYPPAAGLYPPIPSMEPNPHPSSDDAGYKWVHMSAGMPVPDSAVVGGMDIDGATIYVGRAHHEGDMLPAKVIPERNIAYVCHGGREITKHSFEVLTKSDFSWEYASNGHVPPNAVIAGQTSDGEPLYVGRASHEGSQTIGKVQQSHGCLYIPFDGQEISHRDYEVLVMH